MTDDNHITVIVTSGVAANLKELSERLDRAKLAGMFVVGLSATGVEPATHYISSGHVPPKYIEAMSSPTKMYNIARQAWENDGDVFPYTQTQVTNALSKCSISHGTFNGQPENPHQMVVRLGLQFIPLQEGGNL